MVKYVPLPYPKTNDIVLGTVAIFTDLIEKAVNAGKNRQVFYCGNCGNRFIRDGYTDSPLVCSQCGEEFDWAGTNKRGIKVCPQCKREYDLDAKFCAYHAPKVELKEG